MKSVVPVLLTLLASPSLAEGTRSVDAHEHGVGTLNIAYDGAQIAMEFHAPGADIVGFEYEAKTQADVAAVEAAVASLSQPLELFAFPQNAGCTVTAAQAALEQEDADHAEHHEHEKHDEHAHEDEHDHEEHAEENHTEFHAEYALECKRPDLAQEIKFEYFSQFPNAVELEVQVVTSTGANAFEVVREDPELNLSSMF